MTSSKLIDIQFVEPDPRKWSHPLKEDVFAALMMRKENSATAAAAAAAVYRTGSLFTPLLFGKFFDPSDAFPLWEFESEALLPNSGGQRITDWCQTDSEYILKAEIPGLGLNTLQICIENGKIMEISGQWRQQGREGGGRTNQDWRNNHWWEHGCVRRIELSENADWRKAEAQMKNDLQVLEIRIPKMSCDDSSSGSDSHATK